MQTIFLNHIAFLNASISHYQPGVIVAHEFDGKKYTKASFHQREWGNKLISDLDILGNEKILDLGCGDGILSQNLAALVPDGEVIGIDASTGMIETAKEKEAGNLKFRLMDINELSLNTSFDLIFSNATLHWVKDHKRLWNSVAKLLRHNGVVRFNFAAHGNCINFFSAVSQIMEKDEYRGHFMGFEWPYYMPPVSDYERFLESYPFKEIKIEEQNADRYFPHTEALIGWINQPSIVPFLKNLPELLREGFRSKVIELTVQKTLQDDGRCFETFRRIDIFAIKSSA